MKRREFIKNSMLASGMFYVPSFVKAFEQTTQQTLGPKKLVIIQLSGGNDGLNTVAAGRGRKTRWPETDRTFRYVRMRC